MYQAMAAPSLFDGISRSIDELLIPSFILLALIGAIKGVYGGSEAGVVYILISVFVLLGIYSKAKYWNVRYTIGFVVTGLLFVNIPGIIVQILPSQFGDLATLVEFGVIIGIARMLFSKLQ